jgi:hypothetical protein
MGSTPLDILYIEVTWYRTMILTTDIAAKYLEKYASCTKVAANIIQTNFYTP